MFYNSSFESETSQNHLFIHFIRPYSIGFHQYLYINIGNCNLFAMKKFGNVLPLPPQQFIWLIYTIMSVQLQRLSLNINEFLKCRLIGVDDILSIAQTNNTNNVQNKTVRNGKWLLSWEIQTKNCLKMLCIFQWFLASFFNCLLLCVW